LTLPRRENHHSLLPGLNSLKTFGGWAFAEFTEAYQIEADFKAKVALEFNDMIGKAVTNCDTKLHA
jgi:hypothetical protein